MYELLALVGFWGLALTRWWLWMQSAFESVAAHRCPMLRDQYVG
jgi:hypothetical protein